MLLGELAATASHLDRPAFVASFPCPALVFLSRPAAVHGCGDETPVGPGLWARTGLGRVDAITDLVPASVLDDAAPDASSLVAFLQKSSRNPFGGLIVLGRQPRADVVVVAPAISKVHVVFAERPDRTGWTVLDQHSTNGTTLNRVPLVRGRLTPIVDGDTLVLGSTIQARFLVPASLHELAGALARGESVELAGRYRVADDAARG